jgi:DNA-binding CsgD family transcriptional regulator
MGDRSYSLIDRLTPGQRDCLRLVREGMTSKQIGRELGISPFTVDQRLKRACDTLGATSRVEAARLMERSSVGQDAVRSASTAVRPLRLPWRSGPRVSLHVGERLFWIIALTLLLALVIGATATALAVLIGVAGGS